MHDAVVTNQNKKDQSLSTNEEEAPVAFNRPEALKLLTANCSCDKERSVLNEMKDEQLEVLVNVGKSLVTNASDKRSFQEVLSGGSKQAGGEEESDSKKGKGLEGGGKITKNEEAPMTERFTPAELEVWNMAVGVLDGAKKQVVAKLVANVKDEAQKTRLTVNLMGKKLPELQDMLALLPVQEVRNSQQTQQVQNDFAPLFLGAGGGPSHVPTVNTDEPVEVKDFEWMPTLNYAEMVEEQRSGGKKRTG